MTFSTVTRGKQSKQTKTTRKLHQCVAKITGFILVIILLHYFKSDTRYKVGQDFLFSQRHLYLTPIFAFLTSRSINHPTRKSWKQKTAAPSGPIYSIILKSRDRYGPNTYNFMMSLDMLQWPPFSHPSNHNVCISNNWRQSIEWLTSINLTSIGPNRLCSGSFYSFLVDFQT